MAIVMAIGCTACSLVYDHPDKPESGSDPQPVSYLNFELSLPFFPTDSRTPSGDYNPGTDVWENYIDYQNDLHIYIFKEEDNTFLASLGTDDILVNPQATVGSDYKNYNVMGIVHAEIPQSFKVVVLANCGSSYPKSPANIDELVDSLTFQINEPLTMLTKQTLIPMYGIQEFTGVSAPAGSITELGTIFMLRSVAKIEVCVDPTEENELEYIDLVNYNKTGLCAPRKVYKRADYVKNDYDLDYVTHVSLPGLNSNENNLAAPWRFGIHHQVSYGEVNRNVYTLYVPEYRNLVPDASGNPTQNLQIDHSYMNLKFADPHDIRVFKLEFKRYNETRQPYFDIQRNNYYKYTVKRKDSYLYIEVDVIPYNHRELNPDFGIDRDENGNPIDSNGNIIS